MPRKYVAKKKVKRAAVRRPARSSGVSRYLPSASSVLKAAALARAAQLGYGLTKNLGYGAAAEELSHFGPVGRAAWNVARAGGRTLLSAGRALYGQGDYRTGSNRSPTTGRMGMGTSIAKFASTGNAVVVSHREYIGDISSSVAFTNASYAINPGLVTTFPWLSQLAASFTEYDFKQLVFQFKSTSANALNSTNTALGTVVGATQYNAGSDDFTSKQQMENYEFAKSCKPSEDQVFPVECAQFQNPVDQLYVRSQPVPSGQDSRLYDLGNFQLATAGSQAAAVIGELWVSYTVCLYKPRFVTQGETADYIGCNSAAGVSSSAYFGTTRTVDPDSTIAATFPTNSSISLTDVQEGKYIFWMSMIGDAATNVVMTRSITNATSHTMFNGGVTSLLTEVVGTTTGKQSLVYAFNVTALTPVLTITAGNVPANLTSYNWAIFRIPTAIAMEKLPSRVYRMDRPEGRQMLLEHKKHDIVTEEVNFQRQQTQDEQYQREFAEFKARRRPTSARLEQKQLESDGEDDPRLIGESSVAMRARRALDAEYQRVEPPSPAPSLDRRTAQKRAL
nr:putative capsid protein [Crucivirus sp.]